MNHLERALDKQNQWWKYLVIVLAGFVASNLIGAIPLVVVIAVKMAQSGHTIVPNSDNPMDLSVYGIDPNLGLVLMLIPFLVGLIAIVLLFKPLHKRSVKQVINGTDNVRWNRFFFGVICWGIISALYLFGDYFMNPNNYILNFRVSAFIPLVIVSVLVMPFQTTFEEILFRGYLTQGVAAWTKSRWAAIILPATLFGLMHSFNPEIKEFGFWLAIPQYIIYGLVFGLITILDDGIELALGVHAINNVFTSIFVTYKASAIQVPALFVQPKVDPIKETIALIIISLIFIAILGYKYKWDFKILNKKVGLQ